MMDWSSTIKGFKAYLKLEKSLSDNSIEAYLRDIGRLHRFIEDQDLKVSPEKVDLKLLRDFVQSLYDQKLNDHSQARTLSGIRAFYKFLLIEDLIDTDPTELLDSPKLSRKLPDTLSFDEITRIIDTIDLSTPEGTRNKAMLETLYGCGLRVTELTDLRISCLHFDVDFIRVIGKGDKERLIPIGQDAQKYIEIYRTSVRNHLNIKKGHEDFLFLNRRGSKISRMMVFNIIKEHTQLAGIRKKVSPHTFRHSFATHMIERGADLRAVQQMLGHESITTTEIYTHLDKEFLRDTIHKFHPRYNKGR